MTKHSPYLPGQSIERAAQAITNSRIAARAAVLAAIQFDAARKSREKNTEKNTVRNSLVLEVGARSKWRSSLCPTHASPAICF